MARSSPFSPARAALCLAAAVFVLAAALAAAGVEPVHTYFYLFAWWSYVLGAEAWLALSGGRSILFDSPRDYMWLLPLSATLWFGFEALNFRLDNWQYVGLPANARLRLPGYVLSFATVLPGIFATYNLLARYRLPRRVRVTPFRPSPRGRAILVAMGAAFLLLPLAWPRLFFPLVWGAFVLLADPAADKLGGRSLLADLTRGDATRAVRLLAAGLVCGVLWESLNALAGARWEYTLPYLNAPKVFEMPLAGYLGFAPFALECWCLTNLFLALRSRWARQPRSVRFALAAGALAAAAGLDLAVMAGIDAFTVASFRN